MPELMITLLSADGEERSERWPTVDAFRVWAQGAGWVGSYRVYELDEDGDWLLRLRGAIVPE